MEKRKFVEKGLSLKFGFGKDAVRLVGKYAPNPRLSNREVN